MSDTGDLPTEFFYPIEFQFPDIRRYAEGNTGIRYVHTFDSGGPGPHVMISSLMHGNEVSGAVAVAGLLDHGLRPRRGKLTLCFTNVDAYHSFHPSRPFAYRFLDQDLNRVWTPEILDDPSKDDIEIRRAREIRPILSSVDMLMDMHSMHDDGPPLLLCTDKDKHIPVLKKMGAPFDVVCDPSGHRNGSRMIEWGDFNDDASPRIAFGVETGQHWQKSAVTVARDTAARFLLVSGVVEETDLPEGWIVPDPKPQRFVRVAETVAASSTDFRFTQPFFGLETIAKAGTVFAYQDGHPIATPWDDCVLVMPTARLLRPGVTAVRLGKHMPVSANA